MVMKCAEDIPSALTARKPFHEECQTRTGGDTPRRGFVHFVPKSLRAMRQCLHLRGRSERFDPLGEAVTEVRDEVTRSRI